VQVETESLGDVLEQVRDGEGGNDYGARQSYMSAFSSDRLSDDEVAAIVDYVATL
jgi:mono/diheme cytochrome c family protein